MSAYTQNYVYQFGKQKESSHANVMSKETLSQICESAKKYLDHPEHEVKTRTDQQ